MAYSMHYSLPPQDNKAEELSLEDSLTRFITAYRKIFDVYATMPYNVFGVVQAVVFPETPRKGRPKGYNTGFGHSNHKSEHEYKLTPAERILGLLVRRALVYPHLQGNVPQRPKMHSKEHGPDHCSEVISLPFVEKAVERFLEEDSDRNVVVNCLALRSSDMSKARFCSWCQARADGLVNKYVGLSIVDLADNNKIYQSEQTRIRFALLDA
ncbi:hypothetical protein CPC08DRAFT_41156 [Agrocybe pediades]|nr:hypothetical protein CPC08DRAFT_41156 [Agrocybe pediades]